MDKFSISWKTGSKIAGVVFPVSYLAAPEATTVTLAGTTAAATVFAGYKCSEWVITFWHRWNWINPLHTALCTSLGIPENTKPTSYIKVPRDYTKREEVGRINLPAKFTGVELGTPTTVIKNKLGLTDVSLSYQLAGRKPHIVIRQTPRPPSRVNFADCMDQVVKAPESAPLIGVGPQNRQVSVDLDAESPHILVSASTGGGKSTITRAMGSQVLHNGAQMTILDFKRISHRWAKGLPNVEYCRDIEEIHDSLVSLGHEAHRRNKLADEWDGPEGEEPVGPRIAILVEEANATIGKLKKYWMAVRTKDDPKESPAIEGLREILFMGRAVKMNVLMVAQSATAAALGGPEVRECFATRILARYTVNAWRMLVPEVTPIPRSTRHIGRAQVVLGGLATETQVMFMTPEEAAEWAMSGIVAPPPVTSRDTTRTPLTRENVVTEDEIVTPDLVLIQGGRVSLAEAARQGIVPMKADALRQAKRRDPNFPEGEDGKWTPEELQHWFNNRTA